MSDIEANKRLEERTLVFAVAVVNHVATLPRTDAGSVIGRQLLKSGTSIGANYREANRAESAADFIHKSGVVLKEASETGYWLDLVSRVGMGDPTSRVSLAQEARELLAISTTINQRAKGR